ncbi:LexA family protein [Streptomyces sp. NPDC054796]
MRPPAGHLSKRQEAILRFLRARIAETGDPPYLREIADAVGLSSRSTVHHHLRLLERRGLVVRTDTHRRGYRPA